MVTQLGLSGNNLIIFALIHGFTKDGFHKFEGSIDYICKWTNVSRPTVISSLKTLVECGYLNKEEKMFNNVKYCAYTTNYNEIIGGSKEICPPVKKLNLGRQETLPNNNIDNDDNKLSSTTNYDEIQAKWEELNPNLPSIRGFNEKRKKALKQLMKNNNATIEDLYKAFEIVSICSFCQGENSRKWRATLDWLINDTKGCFNRLLEGAFAFKDSEKQSIQQILSGEQIKSDNLVINGVIYK